MAYVDHIQPVPEFAPDNLEGAIASCIEIGVAKIPNMLSLASIERVHRRVGESEQTLDAQLVIPVAPELEALYELICTDENKAKDMMVSIVGLPLLAPHKELASHVDQSTKEGVSLLFPLFGNRAILAAAHHPFTLSKAAIKGRTDIKPEYVTEYGITDGVFLRQNITTLNGKRVDLGQVHHAGAAATKRIVGAIDFKNLDIALPFLDEESQAAA